MATKGTESGVYRVTEVIGTSPVSWEEAAKTAVETAAKSLRDLRVGELTLVLIDLVDAGRVSAGSRSLAPGVHGRRDNWDTKPTQVRGSALHGVSRYPLDDLRLHRRSGAEGATRGIRASGVRRLRPGHTAQRQPLRAASRGARGHRNSFEAAEALRVLVVRLGSCSRDFDRSSPRAQEARSGLTPARGITF